jgi:hypothetical protein
MEMGKVQALKWGKATTSGYEDRMTRSGDFSGDVGGWFASPSASNSGTARLLRRCSVFWLLFQFTRPEG